MHYSKIIFNNKISVVLFSWPLDEINPKSIIHGGPQVTVLSVQSDATMETNALEEIFNIITQIKLPTVIKIEEVRREQILKALKNLDSKPEILQVRNFSSFCFIVQIKIIFLISMNN